MHRSTNLVLTFAKGGDDFFKGDGFQVFVNSLKRNVKSADHVILSDEIPNWAVEELRERGTYVIKQEPIECIFRDRHLSYWNYILDHHYLYEQILICDCRDVVFQADPFEWIQNWKSRFSEIHGNKDFLEDFVILTAEGFIMSQSGFACIENFQFERSTHKKFHIDPKRNYVVNGGVSLGTPSALKNYHFLIWSLMAKTFGNCTDQAAVNWAQQYLKEDSTYSVSHPQRDYLCLTGEGVKEKAVVPIFENGLIKNPQDKLYSIIHQWDRLSDEMQECIRRRFL